MRTGTTLALLAALALQTACADEGVEPAADDVGGDVLGEDVGGDVLGEDADADAPGDVPDADTGPPDPRAAAYDPAAPRMFRLTRAQYRNAVADVFGPGLVMPVALEPDLPTGGFVAVGAGSATISPRGVEQYERAAYDLARQVVRAGSSPVLSACEPSGPSDGACARTLIEQVGLRLWRRPLTEPELDALAGIVTAVGEAEGSFDAGLEYGLAALLQSPDFLFRIEIGTPVDGYRRLDDYEMASRLSFFLWNTTPDDALLEAAARGELTGDAGLEREARRMLEDERAVQGVRNFFTEYLELNGLDDLRKDPDRFTHMSPELGPSAREETLLSVEDLVFEREADFRELFTTRRTFVDRTLAALYDVPAPTRSGFGETLLPEDGVRRGLLGQAAFLALHSHPISSSATLRGRFVRQTLLCGVIPPPPVNVDTSIPEPSPESPTLRERVAAHLEVEECAACHLLMDPIGLGLENFDAVGRYRRTEAGAVIDASGDVDGAEFGDPAELAEALAEHPQLGRCFVRNVFRYATGRVDERGDRALLDALAGWWSESADWRVLPLMLEIVMSDAFRTVSEPAMASEGE